ncbi:MAG TPA: menaquinone biosynthesis protein [Thermodesulfobacteriota bacterium]
MNRPLVVGEIAYANVVPLFDAWRAAAGVGPDEAPPGVRIVRGEPAALNEALAAGEIDLAPCSSIEYARRPDAYRLLPDLSIAADGAVESVLLFARRPLEALAPAGRRPRVALSPASAASNALLRLILAERDIGAEFAPADMASADGADAVLVIGDQALAAAADDARVARAAGYPLVYDLGCLWRDLTGLPFVFALFIVRAETAETRPEAVARIGAALAAAKRAAPARRLELAAREAGRGGLSAERLAAYWSAIRYDLGPREQAGLTAYFRLAARHGLLPAAPPLRFTSAPLP